LGKPEASVRSTRALKLEATMYGSAGNCCTFKLQPVMMMPVITLPVATTTVNDHWHSSCLGMFATQGTRRARHTSHDSDHWHWQARTYLFPEPGTATDGPGDSAGIRVAPSQAVCQWVQSSSWVQEGVDLRVGRGCRLLIQPLCRAQCRVRNLDSLEVLKLAGCTNAECLSPGSEITASLHRNCFKMAAPLLGR
jgi:hypothetical protein